MFFVKLSSIATGFGSVITVYGYKTLLAKELIDCHECKVKRLPKAKELPLYEKESSNKVVEYDENSKPLLISEISVVRKQMCEVATFLNAFKNQAVHIYETGLAHSQSTYEYMKSEENKIPRFAAIASGGLLGYMIARKRGVFKKLMYTSTGTGLMFSAFYPSVAKEYLISGYEFAKHQGSNFVEYGGYDPEQISKSASESLETIKKIMKLEGLTSKLNEWFYRNEDSISKQILNSDDIKKENNKPEN